MSPRELGPELGPALALVGVRRVFRQGGVELAVLDGLTLEKYKPRIVIIEDNSVDGDPHVARHMSERGYVHFRRTGVNEWYAHESDVELVRPDEIRQGGGPCRPNASNLAGLGDRP